MSKATDRAMEALHGLLAQELAKGITEGEVVITKEGEAVRKGPPPALLSVARQFLKDNHIESMSGNKDMSSLEQAMKEMSDLPYDGEVPKEH